VGLVFEVDLGGAFAEGGLQGAGGRGVEGVEAGGALGGREFGVVAEGYDFLLGGFAQVVDGDGGGAGQVETIGQQGELLVVAVAAAFILGEGFGIEDLAVALAQGGLGIGAFLLLFGGEAAGIGGKAFVERAAEVEEVLVLGFGEFDAAELVAELVRGG
jgi:hypothetical protein